MDNDAVRAKLRSAGIPRDTFSTTLVKERCVPLRNYVIDKQYLDKSILYVGSFEEVLPFYLTAKELCLSGRKVQCARLVDIHSALFGDEDTLYNQLQEADTIAIDGFFDHGGRSEQFLTPYEVAYFISWFIRRNQDGTVFILLGGDTLEHATLWWPASFVAYITKRSIVYQG